jgi:ABC-type uncharacterized transport system fused permease/ATPase subunit
VGVVGVVVVVIVVVVVVVVVAVTEMCWNSLILQERIKIVIYCVLLEQFLDKYLDKNARCKQ